jgi:hypothetical protein
LHPYRTVCALAALSLVVAAFGPGPASPRALWESVGTGVDYQEITLPGPNHVFVARMDRSDPEVTIDTMIAQGPGDDRREPVSAMAQREEEAINSWNGRWGTRNDVIVAINGSFHNPDTGVVSGAQVHGGWYSGYDGQTTGALGFGWTMERETLYGTCAVPPSSRQMITFLDSGHTEPIHGINAPAGGERIVLYTPEFESHSPGDPTGVEILVEMSRPAMIVPLPHMVVGTIRAIQAPAEEETPIPFDHIVIAGYGLMGGALYDNSRVGEQIGISLELQDLGAGCQSPESEDWTKTYSGLDVGVAFLQAGEVVPDDAPFSITRQPRTAVAFNDAYVYFVVVDGRNPGYSVGMTLDELGEFARDTLGAEWGLNLDGGGSSTMWVNGVVENRPSDGRERSVPDGLMMVAVESMRLSKVFRSGDHVTAAADLEIRLGPGNNYGSVASIPAGAPGLIRIDAGSLGGVVATGEAWWPVLFGRTPGWAPQSDLALVLAP